MLETEMHFHLEEYKQVKAEVTEMITKTETLIQYTVVVAAAVFAWLATQALGQQPGTGGLCTKLPLDSPLTLRAWWIPSAAVVVVGALGGARYLRIKEMGAYLMRLENTLGNVDLGWEKFLSKQAATVSVVTVLAWLVMLLGTWYVAFRMQQTVSPLEPCANAENKPSVAGKV